MFYPLLVKHYEKTHYLLIKINNIQIDQIILFIVTGYWV